MSPYSQLSKIIKEISNNISIQPNLYLIPEVTDIKSAFHIQNILKTLPHPDMKISSYDESIYMMYKSIDRSGSKYPSDIGFFNLTTKNRYFYVSSNILIDSEEYYRRYFGINVNKDIDKLNHIVEEYIRGLFWVFNYYMNISGSGSGSDSRSWDSWHYPYSHPPLLYHIIRYINMMNEKRKSFMTIENIFDNIDKTQKPLISPLEYYLYITPFEKLDPGTIGVDMYKNISENVDKLKYDKLFVNIDTCVDTCIDINVKIDIRYTYLSKGKLINHWIIGYDEWKKMFRDAGILI
jgi:hypothetical protein